MAMTDSSYSTYENGSRRRSRRSRPANSSDLLTTIFRRYPRATENDLKEMFYEQGSEYPELVNEWSDFWFALNVRKLTKPPGRPNMDADAAAKKDRKITREKELDAYLMRLSANCTLHQLWSLGSKFGRKNDHRKVSNVYSENELAKAGIKIEAT